MSEWREAQLGDLVALQRGYDLPASRRQPGEVPVVGSAGVSGYHDESLFDGPGVAIGRSGSSIGVATYVPGEYWPLNTTLFVTDFKGNDPRWVYRMFRYLDLRSFDSGSAQSSLNRNYLYSRIISVPPLATQRAVAELLGALDDKIEANRKLAATADALVVALLTPFRPAVPLGTIAKQAKKSVNPAELADREVAHYSLPAFDLESTPESVQPSAIKSNKYWIQEPAVLVSKLNPRFPRVWNVPEVGSVPALASTEFVVLEPTICSTHVLWAMAQHPRFARALQALVAGTSGSHQRVRPAEMLSTLVPDPSAVPQATKSRIDAVVQRSVAAGAESRTLRVLRDTLLPKLMSGALKVREAEPLVAQAV